MYHKRLKWRKIRNARDLGGLPTEDGRQVKSGKLIRCGRLSALPKKTKRALEEAGVTTVVDLRIPTECGEQPDTLPEGFKYVHAPILCQPTPGITVEKSMFKTIRKEAKTFYQHFESADEYMQKMYLNIMFNSAAQAEMQKFLRLVEEEEGCILWHCASGKDRAGLCALLVESILGVKKEAALEDYMLSRPFLKKHFFFNRVGLMILPGFRTAKMILRAMMRIKRDYMEGVIVELTARFGSVLEYCKQVLKVSEESISRMREKYLEPRPDSSETSQPQA